MANQNWFIASQVRIEDSQTRASIPNTLDNLEQRIQDAFDEVDDVAAQLKTASVVIAVADWVGNSATKTVTGVTTTSVIWVSPDEASRTAYTNAQIRAVSQATNSVTFICDIVPIVPVTVNTIFS